MEINQISGSTAYHTFISAVGEVYRERGRFVLVEGAPSRGPAGTVRLAQLLESGAVVSGRVREILPPIIPAGLIGGLALEVAECLGVVGQVWAGAHSQPPLQKISIMCSIGLVLICLPPSDRESAGGFVV